MKRDHTNIAKVKSVNQLVSKAIIEPTPPMRHGPYMSIYKRASSWKTEIEDGSLSDHNPVPRHGNLRREIPAPTTCGPRITKVLDELSSQKMIQQFLGIPTVDFQDKLTVKAINVPGGGRKECPPLKIPASAEKESYKTDAKTSDDDDVRSLWSLDDDEHFDPFEDDPKHPEPVDVSDLESLYSLDDELSDSVLCTIAYSDFSYDDSDTDSLESDSDFGVHMINPIPHVLPIQEDPPLPLAKVHLLTDAYAKPIPVIAFFDTGSSVSILNPNILPDHYWKPHHQNFMAANGEKFVIDKISVPINIRLFPKCVIKRRLLGSSSHGKDLLIGFDILHKLPNLRWSGEGLHYRSFFNPWTAMHRLFVASITPPIFNISSIKQRLIQTCYVNPTKASHPGMNPDHYQLAKEECEQLVSQGIIEPTTSPWACEAFYVNKRSEQVRGKLRLVINYQPLNHFLADDKFPLPQKKSLFEADAKVLSKFDLKSGFWQLGIKPEDRLTAFCIPDHHYQWKVMPFGLKNAPSAFQKAMITIFEPILANTLVYIDDILLFSPDEQSHAELLSKFYSLVTKYGIMLSEKKMEVGVTTIQFLGMEISDGKYQPQPHVAQELLKFPDELSSQKMIQQFLGLVNYMADFLPKLSHHTALLFPMLKKNPPQWTSRQTEAVKAIKCLAEKMPPLKIPASAEKRILQTDASDECWGAVLLVQDNNNKRHVCGYKSGTFKASEQHYHSTFKEILAVKRGIEKFQFHLIGHEFQVEMDMSSFPRMLQFKRKMLPHAQLLRWSNWFSQWKFTVKHIKGTENVLADFLSRPKAYKSEENYPKEASQVQKHTPHLLSMVFSVASHKEEGSSSTPTPPIPL
ncbi:putative reverse transcriptase domain, viral movement protein [Tanacetum coccineum]